MTPRQRAFLAAYGLTASITRAAETAKVDRHRHYDWLRDEPEYSEAFKQATDQAAQALEDEAVRRAFEGVKKPVIYQGRFQYDSDEKVDPDTGEISVQLGPQLFVVEYSDRLIELLLKRFRPDKYRDNSAVEHSGPGGAPMTIEVEFVRADTPKADES